MYPHNEKQLTIKDFKLPFAGELSAENRWVKISEKIPWDLIEQEYLDFVSKKMGHPSFPARVAFGSLFIKTELSLTDRGTVEMIAENPYLQYFLGFDAFKIEPPFDASMMTYFRKRFSRKSMAKINEEIIKRSMKAEAEAEAEKEAEKEAREQEKDNRDEDPPGGTEEANVTEEDKEDVSSNKGKLLLDATVAPADITYPTDMKLLEEARKHTQKIKMELSKKRLKGMKKATNQNMKGRRDYLGYVRKKRHSAKDHRKALKKHLKHIERNLNQIDTYLDAIGCESLEKASYRNMLIAREIYRQQHYMYTEKVRRIDHRIVNFAQPHIRPIKRGKTHAETEFGAKIAISRVDGYQYIDEIDYENFNEGTILIEAAERYKERMGFYPKSIHADQIYKNRKNRAWCKERGIELNGPKLGRPPKTISDKEKEISKQAELDRIAVESGFGVGKRRYDLDRIMAKLATTSMVAISMVFIVMNVGQVCRKEKKRAGKPCFLHVFTEIIKNYAFSRLQKCLETVFETNFSFSGFSA